MPRILQVSAFFPAHGGGIEAVAGHLAEGLGASGLPVHWMAGGPRNEWPDTSDAPSGLMLGPVDSFDPLESRLGLPAPLWGPRALVSLWRAVGQSDVVHLHDYLYMPTLAAALFAAVRRRPVTITQHIGSIPFRSAFARGLLDVLNRTVGKWMLSSARQVFFVGRPVMEHFQRITRFKTAPLLVPNGVDHGMFRAATDLQRTGPVQLLFVGRFVEKKGVSLLAGCADLPGARWWFVGWGPLSPVNWPAPRPDHVEVLGRLSRAEVAERYRAADLLVLPSTGEGFPLVLQEALACGTPVLVSTEVFEAFPIADERCVFHVELRCSDPVGALRSRLADLLSRPDELRAARAFAATLADQWSWQRCVSAYRQVFERLA